MIIDPLKKNYDINIDVASQGHVHQTLNSVYGVTLTSGGGGDTQFSQVEFGLPI